MNADETQGTNDPLDWSPYNAADRIAWRLLVRVQPPKDFKVERQGALLRLVVIDRGKFDSQMTPSGADHYAFYWAETVDISSANTIDAGYARSTKVADVQRTFIEDRAITTELNDPKYQNGYFYVVGANAIGDRSRYLFSGQQSNVVLDETIPANVDHFQASESGRPMNGTVVSAISFSYRAPLSKSFAGVQFFLEHYPNHGQVTEFVSDRFTSPGSMSASDFFAIPCRRKGVGTINLTNGLASVTGVGTSFLIQFFPGDAVEIFSDQQGIVQTVTDNTTMTLTVNWAGTTVVAQADYTSLGLVNIYAVALSKAGTHGDYLTAPKVSVLFDAELSPPIAPTLTAVSIGNGIRIALTPPPGTQLKHGLIYKGKGAGLAITDALMKTMNPIPVDVNNPTGLFQFDDFDFTTYEKENGQIYSYYASYVNLRGTEGTATARVEASPRLDTPGDNGPTQAAGAVTTNLLYNSYIYGTPGNVVAVADASQLTYSGAIPAGAHAWDGLAAGTGATAPVHQNNTEVKLPAPTATNNWCQFSERIDAWDHGTVANRRIDKGRNITIALYVFSSGTSPNGSLTLTIAMMNAGSDVGYFATKRRISTDAFDYTEITRGTAGLYGRTVNGSDLTSTPTLVFCTFSPQTIPATVDQIELRILHWDTSNANHIIVTKVMLNYGDQWGLWTPEQPKLPFPPPGGTIPHAFPDRDGTRTGRVQIP